MQNTFKSTETKNLTFGFICFGIAIVIWFLLMGDK